MNVVSDMIPLHRYILAPAAAAFVSVLQAATTFDARDFGAVPDDGRCDMAAINRAIESADRDEPAVLRFEAGTYNLRESTRSMDALITIAGASQLTLLGQTGEGGKPLTRFERNVPEMQNDMHAATQVRIINSSDVAIKNIVSDNDPAFGTAGRITAVNSAGDVVEVEVFPGLPHFDGMRCYSANSWDLETGRLMPVPALTIGVDTSKFRHTWQRVPGAESTYRLQGMGFAERVQPGQGISWHFYVVGRGRQFFMKKCTDVLLENVAVENIKGIGIAAQVCRNLAFKKVIVKPAPPALAVGARDAFHLVCNDGNLLVEECYVKGVRWDPFNVKSKFCEVTGITDRRHMVCRVRTGTTLLPLSGSALVFWTGSQPRTMQVANEDWSEEIRIEGRPHRTFTLELAEDIPDTVKAGSWFTPQAWTFDSAVFRSCTIEGNCGRALLYQGENLNVDNCTFRNNAYANIALGPVNHLEGGFVRTARIRNCRFVKSTWDDGANLLKGTVVTFHGVPAQFDRQPYNEDIVIRDNLFRGIRCNPDVAAIHIGNAQDVTLRGNRFRDCRRQVVVEERTTANVDVDGTDD